MSGLVKAVVSFVTSFNPATFLINLAINFALAAIGRALFAPDEPEMPTFTSEAKDRLHMVRSSVQPWRIIYGQTKVSGVLVFAKSTGTDNKYLHLVIALAGHEVEEIGDVYLNDTKVGTLDASGNVTTGRFAGVCRIKKHLGTATQAADANLVSEVSEWTTNHRLRGRAYIYLRLLWDKETGPDKWPTGIPNPSAVVKGKNDILDPRDASTGYQTNAALCCLDYISSDLGFSSAGNVNTASWMAAANICDEYVALAAAVSIVSSSVADPTIIEATAHGIPDGDEVVIAGHTSTPDINGVWTTTYIDANHFSIPETVTVSPGTGGTIQHTQKRYTCNGSFTLDIMPIANLETMLTAMAGRAVPQRGEWYGYAGSYSVPDRTLNEDALRSSLKVRPKHSRLNLFNAVRGTYADPRQQWQATDFPMVTNAAYESQDGGEQIARDIQLPFVTDPLRAQRIAKIELERARQSITVEAPCKLSVIDLNVWDVIEYSIDQLGWADKEFRVIGWALNLKEGGIDLRLQEEASTSYDWNFGEATLVDPAPDTTLGATPSDVDAPTNLVLTSGTAELLSLGDGTALSRIKASWDAVADGFVKGYEIQWKIDTDSAWEVTSTTSDITHAYLVPIVDGETYDVRVRAFNIWGVPSAWLESDVLAVGKLEVPNPISGLTASTTDAGVISLAWDNPSDADISHVNIYAAATNDRSGASQVGLIKGEEWIHTGLAPTTVRYYWIQAVDTSGNISTWFPVSSTAGVQGTVGDALADGSITVAKYSELRNNLQMIGRQEGDASYDIIVPFRIPTETTDINKALLSFNLENYRANASRFLDSTITAHQHYYTVYDAAGSQRLYYDHEANALYAATTAGTVTLNTVQGHNHTIPVYAPAVPARMHAVAVSSTGQLFIGAAVDDPHIWTSANHGHHHKISLNVLVGGGTTACAATTNTWNGSTFRCTGIVGNKTFNSFYESAAYSFDLEFGIHEETLTSPSVVVKASNDGGSTYGTTVGTYTVDKVDLDISGAFSGTGWKALKFEPNKKMAIAYNILLKIDLSA